MLNRQFVLQVTSPIFRLFIDGCIFAAPSSTTRVERWDINIHEVVLGSTARWGAGPVHSIMVMTAVFQHGPAENHRLQVTGFCMLMGVTLESMLLISDNHSPPICNCLLLPKQCALISGPIETK